MTTNVPINISLTGSYPNVTCSFERNDYVATDGDLDLSAVSGDANLKFKIKTSGFNFYVASNGNAPLAIGTSKSSLTPANDWNSEFKDYSKSDSKNIKIKDDNDDGLDYEYTLVFTDGTNHWTLDPKIKNNLNEQK